MAPDTQSIDFNAGLVTLDPDLSRFFDGFPDDAEYAGSERLSAAIKRVDLGDDDDDDDDKEEDDEYDVDDEDEDDESEDDDDEYDEDEEDDDDERRR